MNKALDGSAFLAQVESPNACTSAAPGSTGVRARAMKLDAVLRARAWSAGAGQVGIDKAATGPSI